MSTFEEVTGRLNAFRATAHASGRGVVKKDFVDVKGSAIKVTKKRGNTTWRGVTKLLKAAFWPKYTWGDVRKGAEPPPREPTASMKAKTDLMRKRGVTAAVAGRMCGRALHRAIETRVSEMTGRPVVADSGPTPLAAFREGDAILAGITGLGIIPIDHEVPLCSTMMGIGTQVDIVGWDTEREKLILIEVKRGYAGTFSRSGGKVLGGPRLGIPNTACNHAHLQNLVAKHWLINEASISSSSIDCAVVQFNDWTETVMLYNMPAVMNRHRVALMDYFNGTISQRHRATAVSFKRRRTTK